MTLATVKSRILGVGSWQKGSDALRRVVWPTAQAASTQTSIDEADWVDSKIYCHQHDLVSVIWRDRRLEKVAMKSHRQQRAIGRHLETDI